MTKYAGSFSSSGRVPLATPKYSQGSVRTDGYRGTMARLYIWLTQKEKEKLTEEVNHYSIPALGVLLQQLIAATETPNSGYIEFLLQEANHTYEENVEVYETLAHRHVSYALGRRPPQFQYTALLLNNTHDRQADKLYLLYWYILRAMRMAEIEAVVNLQYNEMVVTGAMTSLVQTADARDESVVRASFQILVRRVKHLPINRSPSTPTGTNQQGPGDGTQDQGTTTNTRADAADQGEAKAVAAPAPPPQPEAKPSKKTAGKTQQARTGQGAARRGDTRAGGQRRQAAPAPTPPPGGWASQRSVRAEPAREEAVMSEYPGETTVSE